MSAARAETTFDAAPAPRWPEARRVNCACGCGLWFYVERAKHRPPKYARPECYLKERNRRRRMAYQGDR